MSDAVQETTNGHEWSEDNIQVMKAFMQSNPIIKTKKSKYNYKRRNEAFDSLKKALQLEEDFDVVKIKEKVAEIENTNKQDEEKIIKFYRDNAALWNVNDDKFQDQNYRSEKMREVSEMLSEPKTASDITSTWDNLRTRFGVNIKAISKKNGPGGVDFHVPPFVHFDTMSFLLDTPGTPESTAIINKASQLAPGNNSVSNDDQTLNTGNRKRKTEEIQEFRQHVLSAINETQVHHDPFGLSVNESLKKLNPLSQELAKAEIQSVLAEFLRSQLRGNNPPKFSVQ